MMAKLTSLLVNKGQAGDVEEVTYNTMQTVKVKMVFSHIATIDTLGQLFEAEVYIQARWTEPNLKGLSEEELKAVNFEHCWNPKLKILNVQGAFEKDRLTMLVRYEVDEIYPVVTYMWYVKGMFTEPLELEQFPFDVQELNIILTSERSLEEIDLSPDRNFTSSVNPTAMKNNLEWKMYNHVGFEHDFRTSDYISSSIHPVLLGYCHSERRFGFYMWNVFSIVFIIICLSMTVLSVDPTTTDRLGVMITLFLTCVAFKLVINTTLPNISYLTYLDVYIMFTMVYLAIQAAENAFMIHLVKYRDKDRVVGYDDIAQSILLALVLLFHAVFLVYIQLTAFSRRRSMQEIDHSSAFQGQTYPGRSDRSSRNSRGSRPYNIMVHKGSTEYHFNDSLGVGNGEGEAEFVFEPWINNKQSIHSTDKG